MRGRDAGSEADAVVRLLPQLIPAGVLLTDDPDGAVRLLGAALSEPRALDSADDAWGALAHQALRRPRWAGEQIIESLPTDARADDDAGLAEALRTLPERARAAAVLHLVAGLPPAALGAAGPEVGAAVGRLREEVFARDEQERRDRARNAALYRRPGAAPAPDEQPPALPERLTRLAAGRPLPSTAAGTISARVTAVRLARRRRRLRVASGAVAAALLLALTPLLPHRAGTPPATTVYGGPTRGSLAGDEEFLSAARDLPWAGAPGALRSRRVVFAGDVPGARWALVAAGGTPSRPASTAWFRGSRGASPDRLALQSVRIGPDPAAPVSMVSPATGALVAVGAPGDRFLMSARPYVDVSGSVSRSFWPVPTSRGVAVVGLPPVPDSPVSAVRLQVVRDGSRHSVPPPTAVGEPGALPVDPPISRLRPSQPTDGDAAVWPRLRTLLGQLGESPDVTPVTALWSGDLPGPNHRPTRLTVLAAGQPSGAFVVTTPYGYATDPSGRIGSSWCGTGVLPAGLPLDQRVVAFRCDLSDLAARREIFRFLVVVAPRSSTSVRLLDDQGVALHEQPLADGVAVVRSPGDVTRVVVTTADGERSEATPLADADLAG
jgi:hypothetical protein